MPIIILDEATANVDPENEQQLQMAVEELTRNKTIIMIPQLFISDNQCGHLFRNSTQLVTTFRKAIKERPPSNSLIFHSHRGAPYVSNTFRKMLQEHNVQQSLSNSGQPHDNAVSESFFSSMKQEELYRSGYNSEREFRKGVDQYIIFYNTRRPYSAMNTKIPDKIEETYWDKAM
ncbi:MAG: integrase core domain-containing protein [Christensenellales bacterium]